MFYFCLTVIKLDGFHFLAFVSTIFAPPKKIFDKTELTEFNKDIFSYNVKNVFCILNQFLYSLQFCEKKSYTCVCFSCISQFYGTLKPFLLYFFLYHENFHISTKLHRSFTLNLFWVMVVQCFIDWLCMIGRAYIPRPWLIDTTLIVMQM